MLWCLFCIHRQPWRHHGPRKRCESGIVPGGKKALLPGWQLLLLDKGLYTAPVNDYFKPGEYERVINSSLQEYHPDYWKDREAAKAKQSEQRKERER